jgi:chromate transporter
MSAADCLQMFGHFALVSLMSIGGAMGASPEMHRFLVESRGWLTDQQFTDAITLAQAAPGPNVLFVTLLGWQAAGALGALASTVGVMLPSSLLCFYVNSLTNRHADSRVVRAVRRGLSPIAIGLTASAGWIVAVNNDVNWRLASLTALTVVVVLRSKFNPLWLIAAGAALGCAGLLDLQ